MELEIRPTKLAGVVEIIPWHITDHRGCLTRFFDEKELKKKIGGIPEWKQISLVHSKHKNVLRGMHVQLPPEMEGKMLVATRGRMFWAVIDIRKKSPTLGEWLAVDLTAEKHNALFVPRGFAHGCLSITNNAEVMAFADNRFREDLSAGIIWNDSDVNIKWPLDCVKPLISETHKNYGTWKEFVRTTKGVL
ncbi:MAG: dTDP-4-dehydrorhamnose 3,5-epimerase [Parcubacteria group bacterium Gr01-1014_17]|nr:MAG: dTDP-4-dehydrorhamnose 3,5-epimerase [Parcubacteria group bacterium Gr01-1014_17]